MEERVKVLIWEKISLVVPEKKDINLWYKWVNDIETQTFISANFWKIFYKEDEEEYYENLRKKENDITFSIMINENWKIIWNTSLHNISYKNRNCLFWISIFDKENQNKWYWTETVKLVLKYAFEVLWLNKVKLTYVWLNERGKKVYERVGFREVGRLKDEVYIKWSYYDDVLMEIFREEFIFNF